MIILNLRTTKPDPGPNPGPNPLAVGRNFFWDHFGWELCNRAYYNAIGKLRLMLTLILTPTLTA